MKHLELDLTVSFETREVAGTVTHHLAEATPSATTIALDTRDLIIEDVTAGTGDALSPVPWSLAEPDPIEGAKLSVDVPAEADRIRIRYRSQPQASGLGWLGPQQTTGGRHPFLYSQGEAIHTRSWIPCVDDPRIRITYDARIREDGGRRVVMAAEDHSDPETPGEFRYHMPQPIPTYLIAIAVGELEHRAIGSRTGVWAEPEVAESAAWEFADTESMVETTERLFGPYRWGRYDLLVLPPAFPLGGMENPRLTFATPTVLAGDRSLVSLVAHELAHSWSGNLVTNATWNDFWLNEGFTVYIERRIIEEVFGRARSEMEARIGRAHLDQELAELEDRDTWLYGNFDGRNPDEAMTAVPYEKGYLFLRLIEETFGRDRFDEFLRQYFDQNAFRSMTTARFLEILDEELLRFDPERAELLDLKAWVYGPGVPGNTPVARSDAFERVEAAADSWLAGRGALEEAAPDEWTAHEWIHFLRHLPRDLSLERMNELDDAFGLTRSKNSEILCEWFQLALTAGYPAIDAPLEEFLLQVGRKKFLKPLYTELAKRAGGRERAQAIYQKARESYHSMARVTLDELLDHPGG